jgi:galactokinase
MRNLELEVKTSHRALHGVDPARFTAPGRVNLIGEHTDYSDGFVLPAAINFRTVVGISPRADERLRIRSIDFSETAEGLLLRLLEGPSGSWADYPIGVIRALRERGVSIPSGLNLTIAGDVPVGAGLSSSASIEVATALAVTRLAQADLSRTEIALACQSAENHFVGANCGIMDQFIATHGRANHALWIDCRTLAATAIPLPAGVNLMICNSMVSHSIAGGAYNTRRAEVEAGTEILRSQRAEITKLRDATEKDLSDFGKDMPDAVLRRCRHVITENSRVRQFAEASQQADLVRMGQLMNASYVSYRDDFEASCPEVDILVAAAQAMPGCYGSRLTGGGFGGCTVSLVAAEATEEFIAGVRAEYQTKTGLTAQIYCCTASAGARQVGDPAE